MTDTAQTAETTETNTADQATAQTTRKRSSWLAFGTNATGESTFMQAPTKAELAQRLRDHTADFSPTTIVRGVVMAFTEVKMFKIH